MINLEQELAATLSPQERYDIISFSMNAADDNGFINSFIFERAIYMYAAITLNPDRREELSGYVADNILDAWEKMCADDTIKNLLEEHKVAIDLLTKEAQVWYEEYADWAHSARGILDVVQDYTTDIVQNAAGKLESTAEETNVIKLLDIADKWGMNRDNTPVDIESLFDSEE